MAVTLSNLKREVQGNSVRVSGTVTGPASYTTGGETLTATQIRQLTDGSSSTSPSSILLWDSEIEPANFRATVLDRTNAKVKFTTAFAEVANATNLSAVSINFEALVRVSNG